MKPHVRLFAWLALMACLLPVTGAMSGCGSQAAPDAQLSERLAAAVDEGPGTQFYMRDLTDFSWQKLYLFAPNAAQAKIDSALGFAWPRPDVDAGETILAFVADGKVVRYALPARPKADFAGLTGGSPSVPDSQPWTPDSALFRIGPDRTVQQGFLAP